MIKIPDLENKINEFDSEKICAILVTAKYFGNNAETIKLCMKTLAERRSNGESFDFESYIKEKYDELPKQQTEATKLNLNDLAASLRNMV